MKSRGKKGPRQPCLLEQMITGVKAPPPQARNLAQERKERARREWQRLVRSQ